MSGPAKPGTGGPLSWVRKATDQLTRPGVEVVEWQSLRELLAATASAAASGRTSLDDPRRALLDRFAARPAVAIRNVSLKSAADVHGLHAVVRHLLLHDVAVLVEGPELESLDEARFVESEIEYPFTLERLRWLVSAATREPLPRYPGRYVPEEQRRLLDPQQEAAASAPAGVVQVLAPAGSGKTTVLVERVRELLARGASPERIVVTTFNADARVELNERLQRAGLPVKARTFHQTGFSIRSDLFAGRTILQRLTVPQWNRLARLAGRAENLEPGLLEPELLPHWIEQIKLAELATPREWRERLRNPDDQQRLILGVYELYEKDKERENQLDFADMIFHAVRRLRSDAAFRNRWQNAFDHVLVDEYQDIEPAQELLVRILAAPQDSLFCVGDEDQTLYGWRRASVRRILDLDLEYPGLYRVALQTNYRCPPKIVEASAQLIGCNDVRFPKTIRPAPGRGPGGPRVIREHGVGDEAAASQLVARKLAAHARGQIVVLARTVNALRPVAYAAAQRGVKLSGPEELFDSSGALRTLEAYFSAFAAPRTAAEADVARILRHPQRVTDLEAPAQVVAQLHEGARWLEAVRALKGRDRQEWKVQRAAGELAALAVEYEDAAAFIAKLRAQGLDEYLRAADAAAAAPDRDEVAVLNEAQAEAAGKTVKQYAALLAQRASVLRDARDLQNGIELTTIHRAKGREWPRVLVFRSDEGLLPHTKALDVTAGERAAGEGLEAERRLMYVAMTRAREELSLLYTSGRPSRFLYEAGILEGEPAYLTDKPRAEPSRSAGFWSGSATSPAPAKQLASVAATAARSGGQTPARHANAILLGRR